MTECELTTIDCECDRGG